MTGRTICGLTLCVLAAAAVFPDRARAIGPDQLRKQIEARYPVKVLNIRRVERNGRALYAVKVMSSGGAYNDAWQVNILLADANDGRLVRPGGAHGNGAGRTGGGADKANLKAVSVPGYKRQIKIVESSGERRADRNEQKNQSRTSSSGKKGLAKSADSVPPSSDP